jgi:hypothetical protein
VKRILTVIAVAAALTDTVMIAAGVAGAEERPDGPDSELIEFLGSFDNADDDWLAVNMEEMETGREESRSPDRDDVETSDDQE